MWCKNREAHCNQITQSNATRVSEVRRISQNRRNYLACYIWRIKSSVAMFTVHWTSMNEKQTWFFVLLTHLSNQFRNATIKMVLRIPSAYNHHFHKTITIEPVILHRRHDRENQMSMIYAAQKSICSLCSLFEWHSKPAWIWPPVQLAKVQNYNYIMHLLACYCGYHLN